ncbi:hypothetical protein [Helicobacter rodentium]|nr:hypothetical protein [Helicobacter rodentium]
MPRNDGSSGIEKNYPLSLRDSALVESWQSIILSSFDSTMES